MHTLARKRDGRKHKREQLPSGELFTSVVQALEGINALVQRPELAAAIGDAGQVMAEVKTALSQIRPDLAAAAADMRSAMAEIASAARKVDIEIAPLSQEAQRTLRQVRESASRVDESLNRALTRAGPLSGELTDAADSFERMTKPP